MPAVPERLRSLDLFRGATIASMILVNNPGSWEHVYPPLLHAKWHGWTFTDTVFPFFLWIVGAAMMLSTAKRVSRGEDRGQLLAHAFRRAVLLFVIGFLASPFPNYNWSTIRIPGVLQRIAICYLVAVLVVLFTGLRGQIAALFSLYAVYWACMSFYPVPGHGAGVLEPVGNFAQYLDSLVLTGHMWSQTKVWDPEGIWSTLPAIGTVLLGAFAGRVLQTNWTPGIRLRALLAGGAALTLAGLALHPFQPINKNIWTVPFSLFMGGLAFLCLAAWYWLADIRRFSLGWLRPVEWMGMNAILLYLLSGFVADIMTMLYRGGKTWKAILTEDVFGAFLTPVNASLAYALLNVFALGLVGWFLHRRRWYLKL
jgi:predicted acyltransferase